MINDDVLGDWDCVVDLLDSDGMWFLVVRRFGNKVSVLNVDWLVVVIKIECVCWLIGWIKVDGCII